RIKGYLFFFSSRRRHTRCLSDWSSDVCSSDLEDGGVVEADPAAVKQVLLHLVTNARDAMRNGGTLHVEVRRARLGAADRPLHARSEERRVGKESGRLLQHEPNARECVGVAECS